MAITVGEARKRIEKLLNTNVNKIDIKDLTEIRNITHHQNFIPIDSWIKLKETTEKKDLKTEEWKSLEKSYLNHLEWRFQYPEKIFNQQKKLSWFITGLVSLLILGGLAFSLIQLLMAFKLGDFSNVATEIAIKTAGDLSFRSSLIGASVLFISIGFFYFYLRHVYEIKHLSPPLVSVREADTLEELMESAQKSKKRMGLDETESDDEDKESRKQKKKG